MPMTPCRYRPIGQPLIAPGATTVALNYDPNWCGRENCGPPPGLTLPVKIVSIHTGAPTSTPVRTIVPVTHNAPPPRVSTPVLLTRPTTTAPAPPAPPLTPVNPPGGGGDGTPTTSCNCSWVPILIAAAVGFGATAYAQRKKKPNKRAA